MRSIAFVLTLLGLLLAACSGSGGSSESSNENAPATNGNASLWVVTEGVGQGGRAVPFQNGTATTVGDVTVEMFIAPYPPVREGNIDLLVADQGTGAPVEGGGLEITFDMDMPHGNIRAEAVPTGAGHYLVPYLLMPGTWEMDVTITHANAVRAVAFIFKVS
jgi:hypothetical protein